MEIAGPVRLKDGKLRFSEINRRIPKITPRMLTRTLRELESSGLINRKVYPEVPPRVEYCLTEKGKSVIPILDALCEWGKRYGFSQEDRWCMIEKLQKNYKLQALNILTASTAAPNPLSMLTTPMPGEHD